MTSFVIYKLGTPVLDYKLKFYYNFKSRSQISSKFGV